MSIRRAARTSQNSMQVDILPDLDPFCRSDASGKTEVRPLKDCDTYVIDV